MSWIDVLQLCCVYVTNLLIFSLELVELYTVLFLFLPIPICPLGWAHIVV